MFILCAEILSVRIRNDKNIKRIKIKNVELKFSQYADDASAFLDGSRRSLEETLQELELFADISGLKTNFDKTHVVWIGAKKNSTDSIKTRWKLLWDETIDHLLWKCPKTQLFIQELIKQFKAMSVELDLKEETFILGNFSKSTSKIVQLIILIAKYFISMCRNTNKPLYFLTYKINVQSLFLSHREIAVRNNELPEFLKSWRPFQELLTTG